MAAKTIPTPPDHAEFIRVWTEVQDSGATIPPPVDDDLDTGLPAGLAFLASGAALLALVIVTLWVLWGVIR
jgi:hypothetical protein